MKIPDNPPGWDDNSVTDFLDTANVNTMGTFQQYQPYWSQFSRIEDGFSKLRSSLYNTPDMLSALLLLRAHGAFLSAVRLAAATQVVDVYPLIRSTVEYSLIVFYFKHHPDVAEIWLKRNESAKAKQKVKDRVRIGPMLRFLKKHNTRLGSVMDYLYESSIDYGAHPNISGFQAGLEVSTDIEGVTINTQFLTDDPISIELGLYLTAAAGVGALAVGGMVFEERTRLISLDNEILRLQRKNDKLGQALIKKLGV